MLTTDLIKSGDLTLQVVTLEPLFKAAIKRTIYILDSLLLIKTFMKKKKLSHV